MKKSCLIVTYGFLGDILFASSVAQHLIEENQFDAVDYLIGFPQVKPLLEQNPHIRGVYVSNTPGPAPDISEMPEHNYDCVFYHANPFKFEVPPPVEIQRLCGVKNPSPEFTVYTVPEYDAEVKESFDALRKTVSPNTPFIAWLCTWGEKSFIFTPEEYERGINVPGYGYGGKHRNVSYIVDALNTNYVMTVVGYPLLYNQSVLATQELPYRDTFAYQASVIKHCDYFIGAEGGFANVAFGVKTPTILTSDFVLQLYGWNGVCKKIANPQLGPRFYGGTTKHIDLDPYLSDEQVVEEITNIINERKSK